MKRLLTAIGIVFWLSSRAQPYVDLLGSRVLASPVTAQSGSNPPNLQLEFFNAGALLPLPIKNSKDVVLVSPTLEAWTITQASATVQTPAPSPPSVTRLRGIILPVGYLRTIRGGKWSVLASFIPRWNFSVPGSTSNAFQYGGAVIVSSRRSETLVFKWGLYYNREFFGNFFMPLVGVDWRIDSTNRLFGVLPGNMTYEHRLSRRFYVGAVFRAITNSYRLGAADSSLGHWAFPSYVRIDDNQLGAFLDFYLTKHVVINIEAGRSFFRRIRVGGNAADGHSFANPLPIGDAFFAKMGLVYRLPL
jgi:hypothetical protein